MKAEILESLCFLFLRHAVYVQKISPHTLRAYTADLGEAFGLKKGWREKAWEKDEKDDGEKPAAGASRQASFEKNLRRRLKNKKKLEAFIRESAEKSGLKWRKLASSSRGRKLAAIRSFVRWLGENGFIEEDFRHLFRSPKKSQKIPRFLSVDEILAIVEEIKAGGPARAGIQTEAAAKAGSPAKAGIQTAAAAKAGAPQKRAIPQERAGKQRQRQKRASEQEAAAAAAAGLSGRAAGRELSMRAETAALFFLLYGGGLRVSEACRLKAKDVDWEARVVKIMGKGGKERLAALPPQAFQHLRPLRGGGGPYLFGAKPLPERKAYDMIRNLGRRAGLLKPLHPHALRHSFATHLLSGGADLRVLQELLGHKTLAATEKYTHLDLDQLARTLEARHPLYQKGQKAPGLARGLTRRRR